MYLYEFRVRKYFYADWNDLLLRNSGKMIPIKIKMIPKYCGAPTVSFNTIADINVAVGNSAAPKIDARPEPVKGTPFENIKVEKNGPRKPKIKPYFIDSSANKCQFVKNVGGRKIAQIIKPPVIINAVFVIGLAFKTILPLSNIKVLYETADNDPNKTPNQFIEPIPLVKTFVAKIVPITSGINESNLLFSGSFRLTTDSNKTPIQVNWNNSTIANDAVIYCKAK